MSEQVPDGNAVPDPFALRQPAHDAIVEAKLPLFCQGDHTSRGELLSQRARLINRAVAGGNLKLEIGKPESARKQYAVTPKNPYRHSGNTLPDQLGLDICRYGIQRRPGVFRRDGAEEKADRKVNHGACDDFCFICATTARRSLVHPSASPSGGSNDQSSSARPDPARRRTRIPLRSTATGLRVR